VQCQAEQAADQPGKCISVEPPTLPGAHALHQYKRQQQVRAVHGHHDEQRFTRKQVRPQHRRHAEVVGFQHHGRRQQQHVERCSRPELLWRIQDIECERPPE
jgi:hypothetical protein